MLIKIGDFEFTEVWDGVFYKKLSNYPNISDWEIRTIIEFIEYEKKYGIEHNNNQTNAAGRRVWGFSGIEPLLKLPMQTCDGWRKDYSKDNPFV